MELRIFFKESVPVGCVPTACTDCTSSTASRYQLGGGGSCTVRSCEHVWTGIQWWSPDVIGRGTGAGGESSRLMSGEGSRVRGRARGWALYSEVQWIWVMVIWHPLPTWTDRHIWKHYLPATLLAGGNNQEGKPVESVQLTSQANLK